MKLISCYLSLFLLVNCTSYSMEQNQSPDNSLSTQLSEQLSLEQKQNNEQLEALKKEMESKQDDFKRYINSIRSSISPLLKSKVAQKGLDLLGKVKQRTRTKKKDEAKPDTFLGVVGITEKDIKFLYLFFEEEHKQLHENALKEMGSEADLKHILEIRETVQKIEKPEDVEKQRISLIHQHVADYLGKPKASKEELRKDVKHGRIEKKVYFSATMMSIYAAFVIEPYLHKNRK